MKSHPDSLPALEHLATQLAIACPYTGTNPVDCPLYEARKLGPAVLLKWLRGLSREEQQYLILYHQCCLEIRREPDAADAPATMPCQPRRLKAPRRN